MRVVLVLIIGLIVGGAAVWFYGTREGKSAVQSTGQHIEDASKSARDSVQEKIRVLDLRPEQIKEDLARTGRVIRQKVGEAGRAIADATADARVTTVIKGKILASRDLSAFSISVNTTNGIVTLSGSVDTLED